MIRIILHYQRALTLVLLGVVLAATMYTIITLSMSYTPDFSVYYFGGKDILHGINPSIGKKGLTPFGYPIATGYLFIPLAVFPYYISQSLFIILNVFLTVFCVWLAMRMSYKYLQTPTLALFTALTLISFPVKYTLGMGQNNIVAYTFVLLALYSYIHKKPRASGLYLGIALLLKPIFGLLLLAFVLYRSWKALLFAFVIPAILFVVSILSYGISTNVTYIYNLLFHYTGMGDPETYYNQGMSGLIARATNNKSIILITSRIVSLGLIVTSMYLAITKKVTMISVCALLLTVIVIIDIQSWQHHFVYLLLPFVYLTAQTHRFNKLFIGLLAVAYILVSINIAPYPPIGTFPTNLYLSHTLFGALTVLGLLIYCISDNNMQKKSLPKKNKI